MLCTINEAIEKKAPPGRFEPEKGSQDDALPLTASSAHSLKNTSQPELFPERYEPSIFCTSGSVEQKQR